MLNYFINIKFILFIFMFQQILLSQWSFMMLFSKIIIKSVLSILFTYLAMYFKYWWFLTDCCALSLTTHVKRFQYSGLFHKFEISHCKKNGVTVQVIFFLKAKQQLLSFFHSFDCHFGKLVHWTHPLRAS